MRQTDGSNLNAPSVAPKDRPHDAAQPTGGLAAAAGLDQFEHERQLGRRGLGDRPIGDRRAEVLRRPIVLGDRRLGRAALAEVVDRISCATAPSGLRAGVAAASWPGFLCALRPRRPRAARLVLEAGSVDVEQRARHAGAGLRAPPPRPRRRRQNRATQPDATRCDDAALRFKHMILFEC